jgi:hypothetical protein
MVLTSGGFGLILAAVLERPWRAGSSAHRTISHTYLHAPNRIRVLGAKTAAAAAVAFCSYTTFVDPTPATDGL